MLATRSRRRLLAGAVLAATLLAACGGSSGEDQVVDSPPADSDSGGDVSSGAAAPGGGLTVTEVLARDGSDDPLAIHGFLIDSGNGARMCEAVAESYPPQCGGDSFVVANVDVASLDGATVEGAVAWVDDAQLVGTYDGEVFTVSDTTT